MLKKEGRPLLIKDTILREKTCKKNLRVKGLKEMDIPARLLRRQPQVLQRK